MGQYSSSMNTHQSQNSNGPGGGGSGTGGQPAHPTAHARDTEARRDSDSMDISSDMAVDNDGNAGPMQIIGENDGSRGFLLLSSPQRSSSAMSETSGAERVVRPTSSRRRRQLASLFPLLNPTEQGRVNTTDPSNLNRPMSRLQRLRELARSRSGSPRMPWPRGSRTDSGLPAGVDLQRLFQEPGQNDATTSTSGGRNTANTAANMRTAVARMLMSATNLAASHLMGRTAAAVAAGANGTAAAQPGSTSNQVEGTEHNGRRPANASPSGASSTDDIFRQWWEEFEGFQDAAQRPDNAGATAGGGAGVATDTDSDSDMLGGPGNPIDPTGIFGNRGIVRVFRFGPPEGILDQHPPDAEHGETGPREPEEGGGWRMVPVIIIGVQATNPNNSNSEETRAGDAQTVQRPTGDSSQEPADTASSDSAAGGRTELSNPAVDRIRSAVNAAHAIQSLFQSLTGAGTSSTETEPRPNTGPTPRSTTTDDPFTNMLNATNAANLFNNILGGEPAGSARNLSGRGGWRNAHSINGKQSSRLKWHCRYW